MSKNITPLRIEIDKEKIMAKRYYEDELASAILVPEDFGDEYDIPDEELHSKMLRDIVKNSNMIMKKAIREERAKDRDRKFFKWFFFWLLRSCPTKSEHITNPQPKLQNIDNQSNNNIMHDLTLGVTDCLTA